MRTRHLRGRRGVLAITRERNLVVDVPGVAVAAIPAAGVHAAAQRLEKHGAGARLRRKQELARVLLVHREHVTRAAEQVVEVKRSVLHAAVRGQVPGMGEFIIGKGGWFARLIMDTLNYGHA